VHITGPRKDDILDVTVKTCAVFHSLAAAIGFFEDEPEAAFLLGVIGFEVFFFGEQLIEKIYQMG
jgi:hypothetical protein